MSNEAAERLRDHIATENGWDGSMTRTFTNEATALLDEALRTERRMVVEEIRERIGPMGPSYDEPWNRIDTILDEIGSAR